MAHVAGARYSKVEDFEVTDDLTVGDNIVANDITGIATLRCNGTFTIRGDGFDANILRGTADPSAGAGTIALGGTLYLRILTGTSGGELWMKTGAADTAWTLVA